MSLPLSISRYIHLEVPNLFWLRLWWYVQYSIVVDFKKWANIIANHLQVARDQQRWPRPRNNFRRRRGWHSKWGSWQTQQQTYGKSSFNQKYSRLSGARYGAPHNNQLDMDCCHRWLFVQGRKGVGHLLDVWECNSTINRIEMSGNMGGDVRLGLYWNRGMVGDVLTIETWCRFLVIFLLHYPIEKKWLFLLG